METISRLVENVRARLVRFWSDLSITAKLTLGLGAVLLLAGLAGGLLLWGLFNTQSLYSRILQNDVQNQFRLAELESELFSSQSEEQAYLLNWEAEGANLAFTNYFAPFLARLNRIRVLLQEIRTQAEALGEAHVVDKVDQLLDRLDAYEAGFRTITQLTVQRGTIDSGAEGELRAAVREIETRLASQPGLEALTVTLLQMRRSEKNFLLRGDLDDVNSVRALAAQLKEQAAASQLPPEERQALAGLADVYLAAFDRLADTETQLNDAIELTAEVRSTILPIADEISAAERAETDAGISQAQTLAGQTLNAGVAGVVAAVVLGVALAYALVTGLTGPLRQLTRAAERIGAGDLDTPAPVQGHDELGALAITFNTMTNRLRQTLDNLAERNKALAVNAEVGRRLSTILDQTALVSAVVDQVQEAFGYYHAHIYLFDEAREYLVMAGGTGEAGQTMLARGHKIPRGRGLVGRAAASGQVVLVSDTLQDSNWLPNPLLPDTQSEIAVPIRLGETVLGVLDVQQNRAGALDQQDADLLEALAGQVAVSVQNARLYAQTRTQADRVALINQIGQQIQAAATVDEVLQVAARELGQALRVQRASARLELTATGGNGQE